ncbi:MAG: glycosyltransferase family 2 protein, partial [Culicoidibacterales bacterium]
MKPIISVIVPIYNVEPYLAACLQSLAQQVQEGIEYLLIDDGSTDAS